MRAIWKGSVGFGLVTVPISLYPALHREDIRFRLLRGKDLSPVNYKRVAATDGKEVEWDDIVKGYEYEKGKFVILKDEDFARVDIEATQTVDIINFVDLDEVNPLLFNKPYYMQAEKTGRKAYVLLRDALRKSNRIAMARVVIKTRQHLAAVKPQGDGLMLELMHFPDELRATSEFETPKPQKLAANEMKMALQLIDSMTEKWNPDDYSDDYRNALQDLIDKKVASGGKEIPDKKKPTKRPSNVIDLAAVLQKSIEETSAKSGKPTSSKTRTRKKKSTAKTTKSTKTKSAKSKTTKKAA